MGSNNQEQPAALDDSFASPPPLAFLPPLYRPEHEDCYAVPVGKAERQFCDDWRAQYFKALHAAVGFAKDCGADGVARPFAFNAESCRVSALYFNRKPDKSGWTAGRPTRGRYHATPARGPGGDAARAALKALPSFPSYRDIDSFAKLITDLNYKYDTGRAYGGVGRGFHCGQLLWSCRQQTFLCFPNPFRSLSRILSDHPEAKFLSEPDDPCAWRLGEGWRLVSRAEMELAFAEDAVLTERELLGDGVGQGPTSTTDASQDQHSGGTPT